jgi:hypothetical protein
MEIRYKALSTSEIYSALKRKGCLNLSFKGVYAADMLPQSFTLPATFIVNTDESGLPGQHWVSIHINRLGNCEYFDSFGMPPAIPAHLLFIKKNCKKITYNKTSLQSLSSSLCGHYCCIFTYLKCKNTPLSDIKKLLHIGTVYDNDANVIIKFMNNFSFKANCNVNSMKCVKRCACTFK